MDTDYMYFFPGRTGDFERISALTTARRVSILSLQTCVQDDATAIEGSTCVSDCFNENNWSTTITQDVTITMNEGE